MCERSKLAIGEAQQTGGRVRGDGVEEQLRVECGNNILAVVYTNITYYVSASTIFIEHDLR